jgi:hypothetical protein
MKKTNNTTNLKNISVNPNMDIFFVGASLARLYSTLWGVAGVIVVYRRVLVGNNCVSYT